MATSSQGGDEYHMKQLEKLGIIGAHAYGLLSAHDV